MTSSNGNIFSVTGHLCGEFAGHWPVTWSFEVFFDLGLNMRASKQWRGWWFETPLCPLWRHCNVLVLFAILVTDGSIVVKRNLCKTTSESRGLSRQVIVHGRENTHDFVTNGPGKWRNLSAFVFISPIKKTKPYFFSIVSVMTKTNRDQTLNYPRYEKNDCVITS